MEDFTTTYPELGKRFEQQRRETAAKEVAALLAYTHPTLAEANAEPHIVPSAD